MVLPPLDQFPTEAEVSLLAGVGLGVAEGGGVTIVGVHHGRRKEGNGKFGTPCGAHAR